MRPGPSIPYAGDPHNTYLRSYVMTERARATAETGHKEALAQAAASRAMTATNTRRNAAPVGNVAAAVDDLVEHYADPALTSASRRRR